MPVTLRSRGLSLPVCDHLIHAYDAVDLDGVWRTLKKDIPDLLNGIVPILPSDET
ncbi:MAG: HepT-like ribonuclease domain-containing protein [Syntrophobacteraceae bacterium]